MRRVRQPLVLVVCLAGVTGLLFLWFQYVEPIRSHGQWRNRVRADIETLAHKRPPEVSKGQWEFIVGWTITMHANCGSIGTTVEPEWREGFAVEFERRLTGPITLADIEWLWDQYASHTTYGLNYSDRFRPTQSKEFSKAQEGCFGFPVD